MKTGRDALDTAEYESERAKHENRYWTPSIPPKTSPGSQNKKKGPVSPGTAKHENGTRRTRHRRKRVTEHKT
jgi:hypothetical protein